MILPLDQRDHVEDYAGVSEDFRKQMFTKQFELLDVLNPAWTTRRKQHLGPLIKEAGL